MSGHKPIYLEDECPFCGETGVIYPQSPIRGNIFYVLSCTSCDCAFDKEFESIEEAIKAWVRRG